MSTDSFTRVLLILILACLLLLAAQGSGLGGADDEWIGRYAVSVVPLRRGNPFLVRLDTTTGQTHTRRMTRQGEFPWVLVEDAEAGGPETEGKESAGEDAASP